MEENIELDLGNGDSLSPEIIRLLEEAETDATEDVDELPSDLADDSESDEHYSTVFRAAHADSVKKKTAKRPKFGIPFVHSDVPLWRRAAAVILDIMLIIFVIIFLKLELTIEAKTVYELTVQYCVFFGYLFFDHLYLPRTTGYTISRWIMGYEILRQDLLKPHLGNLFARDVVGVLTIIPSLGIIPGLTALIRKDGRSLHEVAGHMVARRKRSSLQFIRVVVTFVISGYIILGGIQMLSEMLYNDYALDHKIIVYQGANRGGGYNRVSIPLNKELTESEHILIPGSLFYLGDNGTDVIVTDSLLVIDTDTFTMEVFRGDVDPSVLIQKENFRWLVPSSWTVEELIRLYYSPIRQEIEGAPRLLNVGEHMKHSYSGIFCASYMPNTFWSNECGLIENGGVGFYSWSTSTNGIQEIFFDIYQGNRRDYIRFTGAAACDECTQYLLENIGFVN